MPKCKGCQAGRIKKMKKITFYKAMSGGANRPPKFEIGTGYKKIYTISGSKDEISLIFEKCRFAWAITVEKSGLCLYRHFRTRKEAELSITENLLQELNKCLQRGKYDYYIKLLNIEREKKTVEEEITMAKMIPQEVMNDTCQNTKIK